MASDDLHDLSDALRAKGDKEWFVQNTPLSQTPDYRFSRHQRLHRPIGLGHDVLWHGVPYIE
jgi:hypothetical protein